MNKYVRLKDKIVKIEDEDSECYYFNKLKKFVYKDEGYKTADTIEELCDDMITEKCQELYNKIKEKRDNAKLNYNYYCFKDKELKGQIAAYNDVLSLMESMFEVENEKSKI